MSTPTPEPKLTPVEPKPGLLSRWFGQLDKKLKAKAEAADTQCDCQKSKNGKCC